MESISTCVMDVREKKIRRLRISSPADAYRALLPYARKRTEHFLALTLSAAHEVIGIRIVSIGLLNNAPVHPREVFWWAIHDNAESLIVAHNHPSGDCEPSAEDREMTARLMEAGNLMGIQVLDHIIFGRKGYYSCQAGAVTSVP